MTEIVFVKPLIKRKQTYFKYDSFMEITNLPGKTRNDAIDILGFEDADSTSNKLFWRQYSIACSMNNGRIISIGFKGKLPNGIGNGSSIEEVIKNYGKPKLWGKRGIEYNYKKLSYPKKGIVFSIDKDKNISSIIFRVPISRFSKTTFDNDISLNENAIEKQIDWNLRTNAIDLIRRPKKQILKFLGKEDIDSKFPELLWRKYDIKCFLAPETNKIIHISFNRLFKGKFNSGIGIGSSEDEVTRAYGKPYEISDNGRSRILYYANKDLYFYIRRDSEKVYKITLAKIPGRKKGKIKKKNNLQAELNWNSLLAATNLPGKTKADAIDILGHEDAIANTKLLFWRQYSIECSIRNDIILSVSFNKGFKGKLKNNIGIGSIKKVLVADFGKPNKIKDCGKCEIYFYFSNKISFLINKNNNKIIKFEYFINHFRKAKTLKYE